MIQPKYDPILDKIRSQDTASEAGKLKFDPLLSDFRMADYADGINLDPISGQLRHGALLNSFNPADWLYKSTFNIDTGSLSADVSNIAVRVYLSGATFDFSKFKTGGADVRFADKDDNILKHEIEYWIDTEGSEEAVCWVLVPSISTTNSYFCMYYGNVAASDNQQAASLWQDAGAVAVWHFAEGTGNTVHDSCATPANGTVNTGSLLWSKSGGISAVELNHDKIGVAENGSQFIACGNPVKITEMTGDLTVAVRTMVKQLDLDMSFIDGSYPGTNYVYNFHVTKAGSDNRFYLMMGDGVPDGPGRADPLILNEWGVSDLPKDVWRTYIAKLEGNIMHSTMDGSHALCQGEPDPQHFDANGGARQKSTNLCIGGWGFGTLRTLTGLIDEIKVYNKALSIDEIKVEAKNWDNSLLNLSDPDVTAPDAPSGLTLTLISGGVKIDFTDNSGGTAKHEIWAKSDSGTYALLTTLAEGVVTYNNNSVTPVDLRYYKIRSRYVYAVSDFIEQSIAMLGSEMINQDTWAAVGLAYWNNKSNCTGTGTKITITGGGVYLRKTGFWDHAKKYRIIASWVVNSGTVNNFYQSVLNRVVSATGTYIDYYTPGSTAGVKDCEAYSAAFTGELTAISIKEILFP